MKVLSHKLYKKRAKIFSEWLPSSGYQVVAAPEISFTQYQGPAEAKYSEIWLAVTATK